MQVQFLNLLCKIIKSKALHSWWQLIECKASNALNCGHSKSTGFLLYWEDTNHFSGFFPLIKALACSCICIHTHWGNTGSLTHTETIPDIATSWSLRNAPQTDEAILSKWEKELAVKSQWERVQTTQRQHLQRDWSIREDGALSSPLPWSSLSVISCHLLPLPSSSLTDPVVGHQILAVSLSQFSQSFQNGWLKIVLLLWICWETIWSSIAHICTSMKGKDNYQAEHERPEPVKWN